MRAGAARKSLAITRLAGFIGHPGSAATSAQAGCSWAGNAGLVDFVGTEHARWVGMRLIDVTEQATQKRRVNPIRREKKCGGATEMVKAQKPQRGSYHWATDLTDADLEWRYSL